MFNKLSKLIITYLISFNSANISNIDIKRSNEQYKTQVINIYSSESNINLGIQANLDFNHFEVTDGSMTMKESNTSNIILKTRNRYIMTMRMHEKNYNYGGNVDYILLGFNDLTIQYDALEITNKLKNDEIEFNYSLALSQYFKKSTESGYLTYYINLNDYANNNNVENISLVLVEYLAPGLDANYYIQEMNVYDITNIEYYETWTNNLNTGFTEEDINNAYNQGYNQGVSQTTGLNWLQSCFNTIARLLDIEILPNIKIAYLVGIPLLIELILFVLRFIK